MYVLKDKKLRRTLCSLVIEIRIIGVINFPQPVSTCS